MKLQVSIVLHCESEFKRFISLHSVKCTLSINHASFRTASNQGMELTGANLKKILECYL